MICLFTHCADSCQSTSRASTAGKKRRTEDIEANCVHARHTFCAGGSGDTALDFGGGREATHSDAEYMCLPTIMGGTVSGIPAAASWQAPATCVFRMTLRLLIHRL